MKHPMLCKNWQKSPFTLLHHFTFCIWNVTGLNGQIKKVTNFPNSKRKMHFILTESKWTDQDRIISSQQRRHLTFLCTFIKEWNHILKLVWRWAYPPLKIGHQKIHDITTTKAKLALFHISVLVQKKPLYVRGSEAILKILLPIGDQTSKTIHPLCCSAVTTPLNKIHL